jgi:hypothetical protein
VQETAALIAEPTGPITTAMLRDLLARAQAAPQDRSEEGSERIGVVTDHLFRAKRVSGVFLPLEDLSDRSLAKAWRDLQKQQGPAETEDEGVVKELQQI